MPTPAVLGAGNQRDPWNNFGFVYGRSGVSRGTTTGSGVITVNTLFSRYVVFAEAYDEGTHTLVAETGGGPASTQSTHFWFQPITENGTIARFRVFQPTFTKHESGASYVANTLASAAAVTFRWLAFGY